jgi:hypothetical protein
MSDTFSNFFKFRDTYTKKNEKYGPKTHYLQNILGIMIKIDYNQPLFISIAYLVKGP